MKVGLAFTLTYYAINSTVFEKIVHHENNDGSHALSTRAGRISKKPTLDPKRAAKHRCTHTGLLGT